jgi:hypothetical protein
MFIPFFASYAIEFVAEFLKVHHDRLQIGAIPSLSVSSHTDA